MGEFSRTIGEKGEKIVDLFLDLLGWNSTPINESMACILPEKHKTKRAAKGKSTHGSDSLYVYKSPFFTGQLEHVLISSRYTLGKYQSGNDKFKTNFTDLAHTVECYKKSSLRRENNQGLRDIEGEKISGILFWLSNDESEFEQSILAKLNPKLDKSLVYETIYIVDSSRANYLYNCISNAKSYYSNYTFDFYYIDTGNNPSDYHKRFYDKQLPVELIVSDLQIFRLTSGDETIVALYMKDNFSKESLNRTLGLAHNIAKGLATKINIHFPDYESELHESFAKQVKRGFEDKNIVDNINILAYQSSFKALGNRDQLNKLPKDDISEEPAKLNSSQILPYGNDLRDLLSRSQITDTEMNKLLRRKGVYVANPKKENLVPILSSILLSPSEFDYLREKQNTREDTPKRTSSSPISCSRKIKENGLINVLNEIKLNDLVELEFYSFSFHNNTLSFAMVDDNPNHVSASYTITKTENNKIWFDNKNEFTGNITVKLSENGVEIRPISDGTSQDTLRINRWIKKKIIKDLKSSGLIDQNTEENRILMEGMSNEEVIKFLLSFTSNVHNAEILFEGIISMNVVIDEKTPLPDTNRIKWMENKIKKLQFDGNKIEKIELITDKSNHQYLKLWSMLTEFKLESQLGKATFRVRFFFQKTGSNEFSFSLEKLNFKTLNSSNRKAQGFILDKIDDLKLEKYKAIVEAR